MFKIWETDIMFLIRKILMFKSYLLGNIAEGVRGHSLFIYMESGLGKKLLGFGIFSP